MKMKFLQDVSSQRPLVARALLVEVEGRGPSEVGSTMWMFEDGSVDGQVVLGGCLEGKVRERLEYVAGKPSRELVGFELGDEDARALGLTCGARAQIVVEGLDKAALKSLEAVAAEVSSGQSVTRQSMVGVGDVVMNESGGVVYGAGFSEQRAWDGGSVEVFPSESGVLLCESFAPPRRLVVIGATPAAVELAEIGGRLGFEVEVVDPREDKLAALPSSVRATHGVPSEVVASRGLGSADAVVILIHDYKFEIPVLESVLVGECGYVGVMGGRKRAAGIRSVLHDRGLPQESIARLRMPVGLDINATTPVELAVSIVGEMIAVFRQATG